MHAFPSTHLGIDKLVQMSSKRQFYVSSLEHAELKIDEHTQGLGRTAAKISKTRWERVPVFLNLEAAEAKSDFFHFFSVFEHCKDVGLKHHVASVAMPPFPQWVADFTP